MIKTKISPINISMSYQWFNRFAGLTFDEGIITDPIKRTEAMRECSRYLYSRFEDVGLGSANPEPLPAAAAFCGDRFASAMFGCEIHYFQDQAPSVEAINAEPEQMLLLKMPDFDNNPIINKFLSDAKILKNKYGKVSGGINTGSPLNVAVSLYGEDFLYACASHPEAAQHVLLVIGKTIYRLDREISPLAEPDAYPLSPKTGGLGNCPAIMISPGMYREVILPMDLWYRSHVEEFHVHHCGVIDRYLDIYKEMTPATIDVGGGSDYELLRKTFPEMPCSLLIDTFKVEKMTQGQIDEFVSDIVRRASPRELITRITCNDLSADVKDDTVRALATVHERI